MDRPVLHLRPGKQPDRLRGYSNQKRRERILGKHPLCVRCLPKGRFTAATVLDHEIPLAKGGPDTDANLRSLCDDCHKDVTAEQFGLKQKAAIGVDGWIE